MDVKMKAYKMTKYTSVSFLLATTFTTGAIVHKCYV